MYEDPFQTLSTLTHFRPSVRRPQTLSSRGDRRHIERAICAEPVSASDGGKESEGKVKPKLIVPTGQAYAKMWEPGFWHEWNPMDWCYGYCVYGDERLNEKPYKRTSFQEIVKHWLLREELEYDMYEGENYEADHCHGQPKVWDHQADVELLLKQLGEATQQLPRDASHATGMPFGVNRFAMQSVNIMVIATFWHDVWFRGCECWTARSGYTDTTEGTGTIARSTGSAVKQRR